MIIYIFILYFRAVFSDTDILLCLCVSMYVSGRKREQERRENECVT